MKKLNPNKQLATLSFQQLVPELSHSIAFSDLYQFKQLIAAEDNHFHIQPYTMKRKSVVIYQIIFALLGCLFFGLSYFTVWGVPYSTLLPHLINMQGIQWMLTSLSCVIGLVCWGISFSIKTEHEALNHLFHSGKRQLLRIYSVKKAQLSIGKFFPYSECYRNTLKLKHHYQTALEKIEHYREELRFLLGKISCAALISSSLKETLFNQALMEYRMKIETVVRSFEN